MKQLPHWVLTDTFPAFYDSESLTAIQQTARLYGAMQELVDEYNQFVDDLNSRIDVLLAETEEAIKHNDNLQQQLDQLVVEGDSSVEAAQARVSTNEHGVATTYTTLKERLDTEFNEVTSHLEENDRKIDNTNEDVQMLESYKADKTYVDSSLSDLDIKINSQASGSPKAVYATLSDLQNAFPSGNNNIYLVSTDGNWYYWSGTTWTSGGTYQSVGISDGSISPTKTSFMVKGKNLHNKNTNTIGKTVWITDGSLTDSETKSATDYIEVKPNTKYTRNYDDRTAFYDSDKVFISGHYDSTGQTFTITTPANAKYMKCTLLTAQKDSFQVELGANMTPYTPYGYEMQGVYVPVDGVERGLGYEQLTKEFLLLNNIKDLGFKETPVFSDGVLSKIQYTKDGQLVREDTFDFSVTNKISEVRKNQLTNEVVTLVYDLSTFGTEAY